MRTSPRSDAQSLTTVSLSVNLCSYIQSVPTFSATDNWMVIQLIIQRITFESERESYKLSLQHIKHNLGLSHINEDT